MYFTSECPWCNNISAGAFLTLHTPAIAQTKQKNKQTQYYNWQFHQNNLSVIFQSHHFSCVLWCWLQMYISPDTSTLAVVDCSANALLHCMEHRTTQ